MFEMRIDQRKVHLVTIQSPSEMVERVARAMEPSAFATYDAGYTQRNGHDLQAFLNAERVVKRACKKARAAIEAMKYTDADEGAFLESANAERIEIASFVCAWDRVIDAALTAPAHGEEG